jgi:hypothetical protein
MRNREIAGRCSRARANTDAQRLDPVNAITGSVWRFAPGNQAGGKWNAANPAQIPLSFFNQRCRLHPDPAAMFL